ncbi:MAG: hypothetical protein ACOY93_20735 [Bacillota bacterium]
MGRPDLARARRTVRGRVEEVGARQRRAVQPRLLQQPVQDRPVAVLQQRQQGSGQVALRLLQPREQVDQVITPFDG